LTRPAFVQAGSLDFTLGAGTLIEDTDSEVLLELLPGPTLLAPANDAEVDESTEFSWTAYEEGGLHTLTVTASGFSLEVYTAQTTFSLASVGGAAFPAATTNSWHVTGGGPALSPDDAVTPGPIPREFQAHELNGAESEFRTFVP
jgi:hypothetical protein